MRGTYYIVASTDASKKIVILASEVAFLFDPGENLTFYKADSERLGGAKIQNVLCGSAWRDRWKGRQSGRPTELR